MNIASEQSGEHVVYSVSTSELNNNSVENDAYNQPSTQENHEQTIQSSGDIALSHSPEQAGQGIVISTSTLNNGSIENDTHNQSLISTITYQLMPGKRALSEILYSQTVLSEE